jgi:hypothetical protein
MIEDSIYDTGNEAFRDRMSNTTEDGKRNWFYVSKSSGKFTRWRNYLNFFYFALFFTLPLLRYHDRPFFMINFPKGEFILFGKIFYSGFLSFCRGDDYNDSLCHIVYSHFWTIIFADGSVLKPSF